MKPVQAHTTESYQPLYSDNSPTFVRETAQSRTADSGEAEFVESVQAWLAHHPMDSNAFPPGQDSCVDWDPEKGLLVLVVVSSGKARHIFLSGWDQGVYWATDWQGDLEIIPADLSPGLPLLEITCDWAKPWRERIPADVLQILGNFSIERWAMLCWSSRHRHALELLRSAPTLLWLLLMAARRDWSPEQQIKACLPLKRRDILASCGLSPTQATLKLLAKMDCPPYGRQAFALMLPWLRDPELAHCLRHYKTVTEAQLRFLRLRPELADSPLVREAPPDDAGYFRNLDQCLADTGRMRENLGLDTSTQPRRRSANLQVLQREHDRLVRRLNAQETRHYADESEIPDALYSAPPIPGTDSIVPITSWQALALEGRSQGHCVRSYHSEVQAGRYYVYQILEPERATLGLILRKGRPQRVDQLKGYRNRDVSPQTWCAVQAWFDNAVPLSCRSIRTADSGDTAIARLSSQTPGLEQEGFVAMSPQAPEPTTEPMQFEWVDHYSRKAIIRVIGIGHCGIRAVKYLLTAGIDGVELAVIENDGTIDRTLTASVVRSENEDHDAIRHFIPDDPFTNDGMPVEALMTDCDSVFLVTHPGSQADVEAAAQVAVMSQMAGALTLVVLPSPFPFEGMERQRMADERSLTLLPTVDSLIAISAEKATAGLAGQWSVERAVDRMYQAVLEAVQGITDMITRPGLVGFDFADTRTVLADAGKAFVATGIGRGEHRAGHAAQRAVAEMLAEVDLMQSAGVLVNISGGPDLAIEEFDEVGAVINGLVGDDTILATGFSIAPELQDYVKVTIVAAGFDSGLVIRMTR